MVDDDDDIREMLQSTLSFAGFEVTTAANAEIALKAAQRRRTGRLGAGRDDAGRGRLRLLQLLRHQGKTLPVLFLSARDAVEDRVRGSGSARTIT